MPATALLLSRRHRAAVAAPPPAPDLLFGNVDMPAAGVYIPFGALDNWKAKRALHASQLVEAVGIGNSTMEGSTSAGNSDSFLNYLRVRATGGHGGGNTPFTDGGRGTFPSTETAAASGESLSGINAMGSWTAGIDEATPLLGRGFHSAAAGAAIVFQGYGTQARLLIMNRATAGQITYSANGGAGVAVNLTSNQARALKISGLAGNPNTLSINNTGGNPVDLTCEFMNSVGIVFHKGARFGAAAFSWWNPENIGSSVALPLQLQCGITPGVATSPNGYDWGSPPDPSTDARKPALGLIDLGLNDLNLWSNTAGDYAHRDQIMLEASLGGIVSMFKQNDADVVLIIPHFELDPTPYSGRASHRARATILKLGLALGCAVVDFMVPLGRNAREGIAAGLIGNDLNPHLTPAGYQAQANFLWDNCLSL